MPWRGFGPNRFTIRPWKWGSVCLKPEYIDSMVLIMSVQISRLWNGRGAIEISVPARSWCLWRAKGFPFNCLDFNLLHMMDSVWNGCAELPNEAARSARAFAQWQAAWLKLSFVSGRPSCINSVPPLSQSSNGVHNHFHSYWSRRLIGCPIYLLCCIYF